jgi:hypothetical protein
MHNYTILKQNTSGNGYNINIDINNIHNFTPKSESIKKYIDYETKKVLNQTLIDDKDVEYVTFIPRDNFTLIPYFSGVTDYGAIGIINFAFIKEAYYIFDVYDNFLETNQKLISRNYVKLFRIFSSFTSTAVPFKNSKLDKEYRNIYIPSYYVNNLTANTFYLKVSFFNPSNGRLRFFECSSSNLDSSKNYFKIILDKQNKLYYIYNGLTSYNIYEVIQEKAESTQINEDGINLLLPPELKAKKTITGRGKFIE